MGAGKNWHKEVGTWKGERQSSPNVKYEQRIDFYKDRVKYKLKKEFDDVINDLSAQGYATFNEHKGKNLDYKIKKGDTLFVVLKDFYKSKFGFDTGRAEKEAYLSLAHIMKEATYVAPDDLPGNIDDLKTGGSITIEDGLITVKDASGNITLNEEKMRPVDTASDVEPGESDNTSEPEGDETETPKKAPSLEEVLESIPEHSQVSDPNEIDENGAPLESDNGPILEDIIPNLQAEFKILTEEESKTFTGRGKLTFKEPSPGYYEGEWKDGKWNGKGKMILENGENYSGEWKDGKEDDKHGVLTYKDGSVYIGGFKEGSRHGPGRYIKPDGTYQEGKWIAGKFVEGDEAQKQEEKPPVVEDSIPNLDTKNDSSPIDLDKLSPAEAERFTGKGIEKYDNGVYEGEFVNGIRDGKGKFTWNSGNVYVGEWKNGEMIGIGTMTYENGEYVGEFWDGLRDGVGKYTWKNGDSFDGSWRNGKKDGNGKYIEAANNSTLLGNYKEGKLVAGFEIFSDGSLLIKDNKKAEGYKVSLKDKLADREIDDIKFEAVNLETLRVTKGASSVNIISRGNGTYNLHDKDNRFYDYTSRSIEDAAMHAALLVYIEDKYKDFRPEEEFKNNPYTNDTAGTKVIFQEYIFPNDEELMPEGVNANFIAVALNLRRGNLSTATEVPAAPQQPTQAPTTPEPTIKTVNPRENGTEEKSEAAKDKSENTDVTRDFPRLEVRNFVRDTLKLRTLPDESVISKWKVDETVVNQYGLPKEAYFFLYRGGTLLISTDYDKVFYYNENFANGSEYLKIPLEANVDMYLDSLEN